MKVLAASCVNWMDLKDTVFGGIPPEALQTWCSEPEPGERDETMLAVAEAFTANADPSKPVFLFLFFFGTHFNYFHDEVDRVHLPEWDGADALKATAAPGSHVQNRARNAAHKLDRIVDGFLTRFERTRGRAPIVVFTGDHGEEFRQKGHIGHGSAVTSEQIHVPAVWLGPDVPAGRFDAPTSHADVVPTLFSLLGDRHPPELYTDGMSMFEAPQDRFVLASLGWEPRHAAVGKDLKVSFYGMDAGLGGVTLTDPFDRPLEDAEAAFSSAAPRILRLFGRSAGAPAAGATAQTP
jgi:membrane-anchored protein YejM (alkaline phosphatase superfamily)